MGGGHQDLGRTQDFAVDPGRLQRALVTHGFVEMPITASNVMRVATRPWIHRDSPDRLIVARTIDEELTLLTADAVLDAYGRFVRRV